MTAAIKAAEVLNMDRRCRGEWQNILDKLTPYALGGEPMPSACWTTTLTEPPW